MWVHMGTGRESGKKAWKNTVYSVNTNSSTWLRQKGKGRHLGKEHLLWKAVQTEKLKFWLGDGKKNQFIWRRCFGEGGRDKRG